MKANLVNGETPLANCSFHQTKLLFVGIEPSFDSNGERAVLWNMSKTHPIHGRDAQRCNPVRYHFFKGEIIRGPFAIAAFAYPKYNSLGF